MRSEDCSAYGLDSGVELIDDDIEEEEGEEDD